jgi:hypothetical protein
VRLDSIMVVFLRSLLVTSFGDVASRHASRRIIFSAPKAARYCCNEYIGGSIGAHVVSDSRAAYAGKSIARTGQC